MEHAMEGLVMGASALAAMMAVWLLLTAAADYTCLLDVLTGLLQRNPVVMECGYE